MDSEAEVNNNGLLIIVDLSAKLKESKSKCIRLERELSAARKLVRDMFNNKDRSNSQYDENVLAAMEEWEFQGEIDFNEEWG